VPRLFALDHNFPDPIVAVLGEYQVDAELRRVDQIDPRMPDLDDWELLLALHHHAEPWDGLITTDTSGCSASRRSSHTPLSPNHRISRRLAAVSLRQRGPAALRRDHPADSRPIHADSTHEAVPIRDLRWIRAEAV
jgi:hypothetical protein